MTARPAAFGPFDQPGTLDGVLVHVGGRGEAVPVHLRDGDAIHVCSAARDMATRLAAHLYGPALRVEGTGRWERGGDGVWSMKRFDITGFRELDEAPLREVMERLRDVQGSGWRDVDDPSAELRRLRDADEPL